MTPKDLSCLHTLCFEIPRAWADTEFEALLVAKGTFLVTHPPDGFAVGRLAGPEAELLTLAVHPKARRKGIGAKVLRAFETQAAESGACELYLEVAAHNTAAIALYAQAGYLSAGVRKNYYSGPKGVRIAALVMRKDIASGISRAT